MAPGIGRRLRDGQRDVGDQLCPHADVCAPFPHPSSCGSDAGCQAGKREPKIARPKRQRLQLAEVLSEARLQQVTSLADIQWAILGSSGQISIIPK